MARESKVNPAMAAFLRGESTAGKRSSVYSKNEAVANGNQPADKRGGGDDTDHEARLMDAGRPLSPKKKR